MTQLMTTEMSYYNYIEWFWTLLQTVIRLHLANLPLYYVCHCIVGKPLSHVDC